MDPTRATATVNFVGYANHAAYAAGKRSIGSKQYRVTGAAFEALVTLYNGGQKDFIALAQQYALDTADTGTPPASFFAGATLVA